MNPGPFTLRELAEMAEARREDEWERTSWTIAYIRQACGGKEPPSKFNMMTLANRNRSSERRSAAIPANISVLKDVFIHGRMPSKGV